MQNFFAAVNPPLRRYCALRKCAATARDGVRIRRNIAQRCAEKPAFHRHFCNAVKIFRARVRVAENFSPRVSADDRCGGCRCGGARHLHTILSGVTVIFFLL